MSLDAELTKAAADGGPFVIKNLVPTIWMASVAVIGGIVSFIQKVKSGKARPFNLVELAGEMLVSGFVGVVTYWLCKAYGINEYLSAAGVAISGHMGARAIFLFEQWVERRGKT